MAVKTGHRATDRALRELHVEADVTRRNPLLKGVFKETNLQAGVPKVLVHGLGRSFTGWLLVDSTGDSPVKRVNVATTDKTKELWLESATDASIKVYVF